MFGFEGDKLVNKYFLLFILVGGLKEFYGLLGYNYFSVEEFLCLLE